MTLGIAGRPDHWRSPQDGGLETVVAVAVAARRMVEGGQAEGHLGPQPAGVVVDSAAEVPCQEGSEGQAETVDLLPC